MDKNKKPDWWPRNPYPETIFPMDIDKYVEIVPDPNIRTALSGTLGRYFWNLASEAIFEKMLEEAEDAGLICSFEDCNEFVKYYMGCCSKHAPL